MYKKILYRKAYRLLEHSTPLKSDCGALCGKACCNGDSDTGMYLFPDEESMLPANNHFLSIRAVNTATDDGNRSKLAVCNGTCVRKYRPLACRMFPLTPYIYKDGSFSIIMDPRAEPVCPISAYSSIREINPFFVRNVQKVFWLLMQDTDIRQFVERVSRIIDEYNLIRTKMCGDDSLTICKK